MTAIDSLPMPLLQYMRDFARRRSALRLIIRLGLALLCFLVFALAACLLDRLATLPAAVRYALLAVDLALAARIVWPALSDFWRRSVAWGDVAEQIERRDPSFQERLLTVISRLLGRPHHKGSRSMIDRVALELAGEVRDRDVRALLPAQAIIRPWAAVVVVLLAIGGLAMIPVLDLPALAVRFLAPWSATPAVTTTRLLVTPGNIDLVEGQPLAVRVRAVRLPRGEDVVLHLRRPGQAWNATVMSVDTDGTFISRPGEVEEDLEYFVRGGDARSDLSIVRVLRKPLVTHFDVRYEYPTYTKLAPSETTSSDGIFAAPAGTKATIRLHATEPLSAATMTVGDQTIPMTVVPGNPAAREAIITISRSVKYELGLSSTRGMVGSGPASGAIKISPDKPPQVRILWPTQRLEVEPGEIIPIRFDASDDFGIADLSVVAEGESSTIELPVQIKPDLRRQLGDFPLDLAALVLAPGDRATLRLRVRDGKGNRDSSNPLQLTTVTRSVTPLQLEQTAAMQRAAQVTEDPVALNTCLLRALAYSRGGTDSNTIAGLLDRAQQRPSPEAFSRVIRSPLQVNPLESFDLFQLTKEWAKEPKSSGSGNLIDRFRAAARAQTLRPDGDLLWARDLLRAAAAAGNIGDAASRGDDIAERADKLASAVGLLGRDFRERRQVKQYALPRLESEEIATARQQLAEWANESPAETSDTPAASAAQIEALVMQANADTVLRNFSNALAIDRALAAEATSAARASAASQFASAQSERAMDLVQALDAILLQQEEVAQQFDQRRIDRVILAQRQQKLAQDFNAVLTRDIRPQERTRLETAQAMLSIERWLLKLPQRLARNELASMEYELDEQLQRIRETIASLNHFIVSAPAVTQVNQRLLPALGELQGAAGDNREAPQAVVEELPALINEIIAAFSDGRDQILHADALIEAQFCIARAADALSSAEESTHIAEVLSSGSSALARAWRGAIHQAAIARAIRVPAMTRAVWDDNSIDNESTDSAPAAPGYEDAFKAYLQAIRPPDK